MKPSIILICLIILTGCSSVQQTSNNQIPLLLVQHPFPSVPLSLNKPELLLTADIYIGEDGSVAEVILEKGSGIKSWDSIATEIIRTWQYIPRRIDNKPVACWVHQKMRVIVAEPLIYSLSALLCTSYELADSFYNDLVEGRKFEEIAGRHIDIGEVNIYQYSEFIRSSITKLNEGEFTKPIKYDDHYIIFKRVQTAAK